MVEANVKWANGWNVLVYAADYPELFKKLENEDIVEITSRTIEDEKTKKGKEGRKKRGG